MGNSRREIAPFQANCASQALSLSLPMFGTREAKYGKVFVQQVATPKVRDDAFSLQTGAKSSKCRIFILTPDRAADSF